MAFSNSDVDSTSLARLAKDFPVMLAKHELIRANEGTGLNIQWSAGLDKDFTDADDSDADLPPSRLYDGFHHLPSSPDTTDTDWTLMIDFGSVSAEFDSLFIGGHNLGTLGCTSLTFEISNQSTFPATSDTEEIATFSTFTTDDLRLVELDLGNGSLGQNQAFTGVDYARLQMSFPGSVTPEISEIILCNRAQFNESSLLPYDDFRTSSEVSDFNARSGVTRRYVFHRGRASRRAVLLTNSDSDADIIKQAWRDTRHGTRSFVWMDCPTSEPDGQSFVMLTRRADLSFPISNRNVRRATWDMMEQPPFLESELGF